MSRLSPSEKIGRVVRRVKFAPFLTQLVVTRRCNLSCGYCSEYDKHSEPVPLSTLEQRLDRIAALGAFAIELTGGEPMLHPHIFDLVRRCRSRFYKTMMISNGYLLTAEKVRALGEAGLQELQISIDGVFANDVTIKVLEPLRKKLVMLSRNAKFPVVLSAVLGSAPTDEVLEVVRFAKDNGFRPRVLVLHDHDGQLMLSKDQLSTYRQIKREMGRRFREAGDYRTRLIEEGSAPFKCRSGSRYLYIDEHGIVRWCSQTMDKFGIPLDEYDTTELRRQFFMDKACNPLCTIGCARTCSHYDQWRAQEHQCCGDCHTL